MTRGNPSKKKLREEKFLKKMSLAHDKPTATAVPGKRWKKDHKKDPVRAITKISDLSRNEIDAILSIAESVKALPQRYESALQSKTCLMLFEQPSLRTRVSFEVGMTQMGGHAIYYNTEHSPLGKKESVEDTAKVLSRMCDVVIARVKSREVTQKFRDNCTIPFINALDDFAHPTQMLADLLTIVEKRRTLIGLKLTFIGDLNNNVTYDLMRTGSLMGFRVVICGPNEPAQEVLDECATLCEKSLGEVELVRDPKEAVKGADVIYCDSWMSYGIDPKKLEARVALFKPFQVDAELMKLAKTDAIFMNCLPAARGMEQTAEVIDGPQSVVFDQAENRLHAHKALLIYLTRAVAKESGFK